MNDVTYMESIHRWLTCDRRTEIVGTVIITPCCVMLFRVARVTALFQSLQGRAGETGLLCKGPVRVMVGRC